MISEIQPYLESGQISKRSTTQNDIEYDIYCYTKKQFHECEWDDVTIAHRGKIYRGDRAINTPFDKIFNMNENPLTEESRVLELIRTVDYELLDKVNGHLTIVSYDEMHENVLVSTKGSFGGDLADLDRELVISKGIDTNIIFHDLNFTFMFECLADYDQHLWYEEAKRVYNVTDNTLILLGAIDNRTGESIPHDELTTLASIFEVPVVRRFLEYENVDLDVNGLFEHETTEGYVFHFPSLNFRFKVKTSEYVRLRYMKEVKAESIVNVLYRSGVDNMYGSFDEELHEILDAVIKDLSEYYMNNCVDFERLEQTKGWTNREIAECQGLNQIEKAHLLSGEHVMYSKNVRTLFKASSHYPHTSKAISEFFEKNLYT